MILVMTTKNKKNKISTMKKLNHLMTFESFTNEEFNPLKRKDWKTAGTAVRKGVGFLTHEEEIQKGEEIVLSHPTRKMVYNLYLNGGEWKGKLYKADPIKAKEYLKFWATNDEMGNPKWNGSKQKFIDSSHTFYSSPGLPGK
jgi:hypothetical protein